MTWFEIGVLLLLIVIVLRQPGSTPHLGKVEQQLGEIEDLLKSVESMLCEISQNTEKPDDYDASVDDYR